MLQGANPDHPVNPHADKDEEICDKNLEPEAKKKCEEFSDALFEKLYQCRNQEYPGLDKVDNNTTLSFAQHACFTCGIEQTLFEFSYINGKDNRYLQWFIAVISVQTISCILEYLGAYLILTNMSLQTHPYKLIAFLLLVDAGFNF